MDVSNSGRQVGYRQMAVEVVEVDKLCPCNEWRQLVCRLATMQALSCEQQRAVCKGQRSRDGVRRVRESVSSQQALVHGRTAVGASPIER